MLRHVIACLSTQETSVQTRCMTWHSLLMLATSWYAIYVKKRELRVKSAVDDVDNVDDVAGMIAELFGSSTPPLLPLRCAAPCNPLM